MSEPFIGQIIQFAGNFAPRGWAFCNGQLLAISQHPALFEILGTIYGGDGRTTFALPDLRGRVAVHSGSGPGLSPYSLGQKGGTETATLTASQLPSHTHPVSVAIQATNEAADAREPVGNTLAMEPTGSTAMYKTGTPTTAAMDSVAAGTSGSTGGGQSHNNRQPFVAINFIIALEGRIPWRT